MKRLSKYNEIGKIIIDTSDMFQYSKEEQDKVKLTAIKMVFEHHYQNNPYFKELCDKRGLTPDDIQNVADLPKIPLIPQTDFKRGNGNHLFSLPIEQAVLLIQSSGTTGTKSKTYRDFTTADNAVLAFIKVFEEFFDIAAEGAALYLTPSVAEAPRLGLLRALAMIRGMINTQYFAIKGQEFDFNGTINFLQEWGGKYTRYILGPTFVLKIFLDYLETHNITLKLDEKSRIITTGGWKHYSGKMISRPELFDKCIQYLGVKSEQVRDVYGCIESNILGAECEKHQKHIPSYAHFYTRDMHDFTKVAHDGKEGLLCIMDPTNISWPGFILTEDIVTINYKECECGRRSTIMEYIGRAPKSELITCATTLEQFMEKKIETL